MPSSLYILSSVMKPHPQSGGSVGKRKYMILTFIGLRAVCGQGSCDSQFIHDASDTLSTDSMCQQYTCFNMDERVVGIRSMGIKNIKRISWWLQTCHGVAVSPKSVRIL